MVAMRGLLIQRHLLQGCVRGCSRSLMRDHFYPARVRRIGSMMPSKVFCEELVLSIYDLSDAHLARGRFAQFLHGAISAFLRMMTIGGTRAVHDDVLASWEILGIPKII